MKKIIIVLSMVFLTFSLSSSFYTVSANNDFYIIQEVEYLESIYNDSGELVERNSLDEKTFNEKAIESKDDIINTNLPLGSVQPLTTLNSTVNCNVSNPECVGEDEFPAEYTVHTTTVTVYPNAISPESTAMNVTSELKWVKVPSNRMDDIMSVSWDGDHFSETYEGVEATIRGTYTHHTYTGFLCLSHSTETFNTPANVYDLDYTRNRFKVEDDGIIFQAPLFKDIVYNENCDDYDIFDSMTITLSVDLIIDSIGSINSTNISNASIQAEYIHFWNQLVLNPTIAAGISIDGPSAGITLTPAITTKHDGPRTNDVYFIFTD